MGSRRPPGNAIIEQARNDVSARRLRLFIAARSRYAEDVLQIAIASGVRQLQPPVNLRIYEVDHPSTQEWKRGRHAAAGIVVPAAVVFTPIDFEHHSSHHELAARVLSVGEMFRTYWETEPLHARLRDLGYRQFEDLSPVEIVARFLPGRVGTVSDRGGHIIHASTGD